MRGASPRYPKRMTRSVPLTPPSFPKREPDPRLHYGSTPPAPTHILPLGDPKSRFNWYALKCAHAASRTFFHRTPPKMEKQSKLLEYHFGSNLPRDDTGLKIQLEGTEEYRRGDGSVDRGRGSYDSGRPLDRNSGGRNVRDGSSGWHVCQMFAGAFHQTRNPRAPSSRVLCFQLLALVGEGGFEPPTPCL
jgi:hypothetical protein